MKSMNPKSRLLDAFVRLLPCTIRKHDSCCLSPLPYPPLYHVTDFPPAGLDALVDVDSIEQIPDI
jgi:hypothetical protein